MQALEVCTEVRFGAVALGANLPSRHGSPAETLKYATKLIEIVVDLEATSQIFATPAFPKGAGPDYANGAVFFRTVLCAQALLSKLHQIEADIGRVRDQRWGARAVDLDLLFLGNMVLPDAQTQTAWRGLPLSDQIEATPDQLILPHPRLQDRAFVLVPLAQVAPDWVHPLTGQTVIQMRDALPDDDIASVRPA